MPEGTVKFFNRAKGFGFIVPDDGDKEVFLPPAALNGLGGIKLSPGQRVAFDLVEDPKGPKAAALKVLGEAPVAMAAKPPVYRAPSVALSLYCDPAGETAQDILAALETLGHQVQVIDITAMALTVPQLRKWSQMLAGLGQGLVRRSSALFFDLQLDDRFLTEDEFWTAVVQHPALIAGPILSSRERVRLCRTPADVRAFFAATEGDAAARPKEISSRLMAMMRGEAVPPRPEPADEPDDEEDDEEEDDELEEDQDEDAADADLPPAPKAVKKAAAPKAAKPAAKKTAAKPAVRKAAPAKPAKKAAPAKKKK
jgi:cold shock CspA family protein/arsenate reductase-like glutaredoxin family protein